MSRKSICIFLLVLFVLVEAKEFQSVALNQGRLNLQNLDTTATGSSNFGNYTNNLAVTVNLGEEYLTRNSMTRQNQTDMIVLLHSSVTSFCTDCLEFVNYKCEEGSCNVDTTLEQSFFSPYYSFIKDKPINQSVAIGNLWQLSTNASLFSSDSRSQKEIHKPDSSTPYINNASTYGFVGLGVGGGAASNFKGNHPLFSISMNSTGSGKLLFGKDKSLYDALKTPVATLTADPNWTMITQNLTFGAGDSSTAFISNLVFDLQHPGIAIPYSYWGECLKILESKYNIKYNETYGIDKYYYTYYGNLTDLPNLIIGFANGESLSIPPAAYTRKSNTAKETFVILIDYYSPAEDINYTILGWPVLSQFYTVFEKVKDSEPTISLYSKISESLNSQDVKASTPGIIRGIQVVVFVLMIAGIWACLRNRSASKLKNELTQDLRSSTLGF